MEIKDILKNRRHELGLTLTDVADAVGVKAATVSRWESGDIENMRRDRIEAYAHALGISPLAILGFEEPAQDSTQRRLEAYCARLNRLSEADRSRALKMIDSIIEGFEE